MRKMVRYIWLVFFLILGTLSFQKLFSQNYKGTAVQIPCAIPNEILYFYRGEDTTTVVKSCTTNSYGIGTVELPSTGRYRIKAGSIWRSDFSWTKFSGDTAIFTPVKISSVISAAPFVDVRYFGAKGDGATDDYLAIQKAIDSLSTGQTGIYMPAGVYLISQPLRLKNSTKIYGAGSPETGFLTQIYYSGTSDFALKTDSTLGGVYNLVLENLVIKAGDADGGIRLGCTKSGYTVLATLRKISIRDYNKYGAVGLQLEGIINSSFEDIRIDRVNGKAMRIIASSDVQPGPINFLNCVFGSGSTPSCSIGVEIQSLNSGIHTLNFMGCIFSGAKRAGVLIKAGTNGWASAINFLSNSFECNVYDNSKGIEIEEIVGGSLISNGFAGGDRNGGIGIYLKRKNEAGTGMTLAGVSIMSNRAVSYGGINSYFVKIDSTGGDFYDNFYGMTGLVGVTTEILDPAFQLRYFKMKSGTSFPFTNPSMQMFYKTAGDTLGIWNGSAWRKIVTQ